MKKLSHLLTLAGFFVIMASCNNKRNSTPEDRVDTTVSQPSSDPQNSESGNKKPAMSDHTPGLDSSGKMHMHADSDSINRK